MLWAAGISSLIYPALTTPVGWPAAHLLSLMACFLLGYRWQLTWLWQGLACVLTLNLAIALLWKELPYGLAGNPNYFGVAIAIGLAGALGFRALWFLPVACVGLWYCQSRTALVGAGVAFFVAGIRRFPATAICTALLCLLVAVIASEDRGGSFWQRMGIWQMTLNNLTLLGHGWGSFPEAFNAIPVKINLTGIIANHAYNDWLQLIFELGIFAIPVLLFGLICFEGHDDDSRLVLWTYLAMSFTYFPLWIPVVGQFVALALGQLAASRKERTRQWHVGDLPRVTT